MDEENKDDEKVRCPKCAYHFTPRAKKLKGEVLCPLCKEYGLEGKAVVCAKCRAFCRCCGENTALLKIVNRKGRGISAICLQCYDDITNANKTDISQESRKES